MIWYSFNLQTLVASLETKIQETEQKFEETENVREEWLKKATDAESQINELKNTMLRFFFHVVSNIYLLVLINASILH